MTLQNIIESVNPKRKGRSIKDLKPNPNSRYKDGYFPKDKCTKYLSVGNEPCIYRSSLEFKTFLWCENSPNVKAWASEPFSIPYYHKTPNGEIKKRNYNIDLIVEFTDGRIWFVEIKPYELTKKGSHGFELNASKWRGALKWCEEQPYDIKFRIITEKFNFLV